MPNNITSSVVHSVLMRPVLDKAVLFCHSLDLYRQVHLNP